MASHGRRGRTSERRSTHRHRRQVRRTQGRVQVDWLDSEEIESRGAEAVLRGADAILVPGGFGKRGFEGKIAAAKYAREAGVPYFGICYGMHAAVIEFARDVAG